MVIKVYSSFMKNNNKSKIFANKCSALPQLELNIFLTYSDIHKILFCITLSLSYELKKIIVLDMRLLPNVYTKFSESTIFEAVKAKFHESQQKEHSVYRLIHLYTKSWLCGLEYLVETLGNSLINDTFFSSSIPQDPSQRHHDLAINDYVLRFVIHS